MKILFISSQALFDKTRFGGAKRLYYLARELEYRTDLHLICLDGGQEWDSDHHSGEEFEHSLFLSFSLLKFTWRKFFFLPGVREALSFSRKSIDDFLKDQNFDATLLAYPYSLGFLNAARKQRMGRIFYLEDDLLLENFRKDNAGGGRGAKRWIKFFRFRQAHHFFKRWIKQVDAFICISRQEEKVVNGLFPGTRTHVLQYGIPLENYPLLPKPTRKNVLGFIGNYRHKPNLDALSWLVDDLFPFVLKHQPDARLVLAGKNFPTDLKTTCERSPGIEICEDVENLADFYDRIDVFINPMREGRGLRTKVVEAAAFGRPILSTALGAEGLEEMEMIICETPGEFFSAFAKLSSDEGTWQKMVLDNRQTVTRNYSISAAGEQLVEILRS